ncbi:hypothetical protein [uncultured Methylobacterium sp.]|jgi:hypothetical protein|uniref:hypothetical protein n=1 Tax=uncultured Methylobacterium sp. TaxID=157278 RepID=UPI00260CEFD1|nr:hypothetical protein [uncultured Methylobacterium sp.]
MSIIDNAAVARIATRDLTDDTLALLELYGHNDKVIFLLARLVWQGEMVECVPALAAVGRDSRRGLYARMVSIRAVMALGDGDDKDHLLRSIADDTGPIDRMLLTELTDMMAPTASNIELLLRILSRIETPEYYSGSISERLLDKFIDKLPLMVDEAEYHPLEQIVVGLNDLVAREPFLEHVSPPMSERFAWMMPAALRAIDRLVAARSRCVFTPAVLSLMQKSSGLNFLHRGDFGKYPKSLDDNVRRWPELNDAIYWSSVAECRERIKKEGKSLVDDWEIAYMGPIWDFAPDDFDRCLDWVKSKTDEDDRLVAMSRCIRIYKKVKSPNIWREKLFSAVEDNDNLKNMLEQRLSFSPTAEFRKIEAKNRRFKRQNEIKRAKHEASRAEWVRSLQADPDRVRRHPTLAPDEFSNDQYHLLQSALGGDNIAEYSSGANWQVLIPEFGESVSHAYRDAAVAYWRAYRPLLRAEGADTMSVPYALLFGMAGIAIEVAENPSFVEGLSEDEVRHALRYVTWELNGFPGWFESFYRVHSALCLKVLAEELTWEFERSLAGETIHGVLHDIAYHAPWLHTGIASFLLAWFKDNEHPDPNGLRDSLLILSASEIANDALARLASIKSREVNRLELKAQWLALWTETDAGQAIAALENFLTTYPGDDSQRLALLFINALLGDRHSAGNRRNNYVKIEYINRLYLLMLKYIKMSDDIKRAGTGSYSPTLRDNAQSARDRLFQMITNIPGEDSYAALSMLAVEHPEPHLRPWIALQARKRAIADADEPSWTIGQMRAFAQ